MLKELKKLVGALYYLLFWAVDRSLGTQRADFFARSRSGVRVDNGG
jgi:hypothetical protein